MMQPLSQQNVSRADELKRALLAIRDLRRQVQQLENRAGEPIAIIGMSCRLPGGANTPERYWDLLINGVDATSEVPADRWDVDAYYDPDPDAPGRMYTRRGGFLTEPLDRFDAPFFGISPREASALDPIHRMLLELSWEALERAGIAPQSLEGSDTGVFVGLSGSDYGKLQSGLSTADMHMYSGTGWAPCIAGGRIAHFLGLHGPNFAVDTACSSSLVSVVLAVESLRAGRCSLALAGGANAMLVPETTVYMCKLRALSASGRCRTFDAAADGYTRGEGAGMIVLKRLADAQRDGDPVIAVIRGAATNHDGRSSGLTVPNPAAQRAVIEAALRDAGLDANDIDYVEAHGTATPLGDPIEVRALVEVLGRTRPTDNPLLIGSVKANLGHLEAAAGVSSLMKLALAISHAEIPPHINCVQPTPQVNWDEIPVRITHERTSWKPDARRIGGVSAFGLSGTNAHIILENPPAPAGPERSPWSSELIVLSGKSRDAVRDLAARFRDHIAQAPASLGAVALTSLTARSAFSHRAAIMAPDADAAIAALDELVQGPKEAIPQTKSQTPGRIAFLFTGQGAQYAGMGRELYTNSEVARAVLQRCDEILRPHMDRSLAELLTETDNEVLKQTQYAQPALFAIEYALAALWQSWGIQPAFVAGHSLGEYVAATVAGVLSLEDALPIVALRGRLMQELPAGGRMCAVFAPESQVARCVADVAGVSIAGVNGPANTVISGPGEAVAAVLSRLQQEGIDSKELHVSHAFHSALMDPILDRFEDAMRHVTLNPPRIPLISNLTGDVLTAQDAVDPRRWRRHIREGVRFSASLQKLHELGARTFLEVGPHPALLPMGMGTITDAAVHWLASMHRGKPAWQQILETTGELWKLGYELDVAAYAREHGGRRAAAPTYPFQRERYWFTDDVSAPAPSTRSAIARPSGPHPLLNSALNSPAFDGWVFETVFEPREATYLHDHRVGDRALVPAAAIVEMMLAAALHGPGWVSPALDRLLLMQPLVLDAQTATHCQVIVGQPAGGTAQVRIVASTDAGATWAGIASGTLRIGDRGAAPGIALETVRLEHPEGVDVAALYASIEQRGITYGPAFRTLAEAWTGTHGALGRARLNGGTTAEKHLLHPSLLDAAFQLLASISGTGDDASATFLPGDIDTVRVFEAAAAACWIQAQVREVTSDHLTADLRFYGDDGRALAALDGLHARRVRAGMGERIEDPSIHAVEWEEVTTALPQSLRAGRWLLIDDGSEKGVKLQDALGRRGASCERIGTKDTAATVPGDRFTGAIHMQSLSARFEGQSDEVAAAIVSSADVFIRLLRDDVLAAGTVLRVITRGAAGTSESRDGAWPVGAALWGAVPAIRAEHPELDPRIIDVESEAAIDYDVLAEWLLGDTDEDRILLREGRAFAPRLVHDLPQPEHPRTPDIIAGANYRMRPERRGTIDTIRYVPIARVAPEADEVEIRVQVTGLNFRDVLNVLGMFPGNPGDPGVEFAGIVTRVGGNVTHVAPGDSVIGIGIGAFAAYTTCKAHDVVAMPSNLTPEEAATIPLPFMSAEWGLTHAAGLRAGERVLIHAAAGGVGQAAVQVAQAIGAEIFATAGSETKRDYLRRQGVTHVFDSRSASFADEILAATGGEGVDVVLNSLTGDLLRRSLDLLRPGGRFIELGLADLLDPAELAKTHPGVRYEVFQLGSLPLSKQQFNDMFNGISRRFETGELRPLEVRAYAADRIADAFRYMAQAKHIGKVVVASARLTTDGVHRDGAYLVTGASGGIGRALAEWLVERGAGAIVLSARSKPDAPTEAWLETLRDRGTSVTWVAGDVAVRADANAMIAAATATGVQLRGVFHAAGVVDDGLLRSYDAERFARVIAPKVQGVLNLHAVTERTDLDHFVLFSSTAALMGGAGQVAYASANAFLGGLARHRRSRGLAALCIDWGAWAGAGMAGRLSEREATMLEQRGLQFLEPAAALDTLGRLLERNPCHAVVMSANWERLRDATDSHPLPMLRRVLKNGAKDQAEHADAADQPLFDLATLAEQPAEERDAQMIAYVLAAVGSVLRLRAGQLDSDTRLATLGLDSLTGMELRNRIEADTGVLLPIASILQADVPAALATAVTQAFFTGQECEPVALEAFTF